MKRIISGIQPSCGITLGNYLGSIQQFVQLQNNYEMFIFVADLHALTTGLISKELLNNSSKNLIRSYLACGLDINKVTLFLQSSIYEHTALAYLLMCNTTIGELNRMTQFKDKSAKYSKESNGTQKLPTGLLIYPVLMAADILLYSPDLVPVGNDQKQHIELARNIAIRLNNKYDKNLFKVPDILLGETGGRIMDLVNPKIKMSKSNENHKGVIFLNDPIEVSIKKILTAKTDSFNQVKYNKEIQPEIANLIDIYCGLAKMKVSDVEKKYSNLSYKEFKQDLASYLEEFLSNYQTKYNQITDEEINDILSKGFDKVKPIVTKQYNKVSEAIGLYQYDK